MLFLPEEAKTSTDSMYLLPDIVGNSTDRVDIAEALAARSPIFTGCDPRIESELLKKKFSFSKNGSIICDQQQRL